VKKFLAVGAIIMLLGPLSMFAKTEVPVGKFSLAASLGGYYPQGRSFKNTYSAGLGGGLTVGYRLSRAFQAVLDLGFDYHKLDHGIFSPYYTVSGGNLGIFSAVPGVKFYIPSKEIIASYLLAGAGLFQTTVGELTVSAPGFPGVARGREKETRFGYIIGGGLEYLLLKAFSLMGEFRFTDLFPGSKGGDNESHLRHYSFRLGARLIF